MTMYVPYIARIATIDEVLGQAHLRQDFVVLDYEDTYERGQVVTAKITVKNPGLSLLDPTAPQYVAVIESPDGTFANARVLLVGRLIPKLRFSGAIGSNKIDLEVQAAPLDIKNRQFDYARRNCQANPQFDNLCDDLNFDSLDGILVATSLSWYVHPVNHAVNLIDNLEGDALYDLGSNYVHKSLRIEDTGKPPASRVKIKAQVQLQQRAYGACNIASQVNDPGTGIITTMDGDHFETALNSLPTNYVNYATGSGGWKKEPGSDVAAGILSETGYVLTGRQYLVTEQPTSVPDPTGTDPYDTILVYKDPYNVSEYATMYYMTYSYLYNYMMYDYNQSRTETVYVYCDYPIQGVSGVSTEVDLGTVTVKDVYTALIPNPLPPPEPDPNGDYILPYAAFVQVLPWSLTTIYNKGDQVTLGNLTYECQNDNVQGYFYEDFAAVLTHKNWVQVPSQAALPDQRSPSFFDTGRGQLLIEHLILRCEAAARNLSQNITATFDTDWETGVVVRLKDTIRITFWDASTGTGKALKGTVKRRTRKISGKSGKKITFTLSVATGDATNVAVPQVGPTVYVDPTLSAVDYYNNVTSTLGLTQQQLTTEFQSIYNFTAQYPETLLGSFGVGHCAWTYGSQPLIEPVDAFLLDNPLYSVLSVTRINEAGYQFGMCAQYGYQGWDPRDAVFEHPTSINVTMRDIAASGNLERRFDVAAQVMYAPRGIDLVNGGEP